jgi:molybdopterin-guanine dinucleotide biosynthesis protein A
MVLEAGLLVLPLLVAVTASSLPNPFTPCRKWAALASILTRIPDQVNESTRLYVQMSHNHTEKYPDLAVAVLAGGASSRFGTDKATLRICPSGPTLIETVVRTALHLSNNVFVIGHARYEELLPNVPVLPDELPGEGPLAGIASALRQSPGSRVLVLACDMPCLSPRLLESMATIDTDGDAVVARTTDGRWQPMPAIYNRTALPLIDRALREGRRSIVSVIEHLSITELTEVDLRPLDPELMSFFSLNRPTDLDLARRCAVCN